MKKRSNLRKHDRLGNDIHDDPYDEHGFIKNSWLSEAKKIGVDRFILPKNEYDLKLEKLERDEENYYNTIKLRTYLDYDSDDKEITRRRDDITVISDFDFIKSNFMWLRNLKIWWFKFKNRNNDKIILPNKYEELLAKMFTDSMKVEHA